eukprot:3268138-Pyramimonas_sp.AAC.1
MPWKAAHLTILGPDLLGICFGILHNDSEHHRRQQRFAALRFSPANRLSERTPPAMSAKNGPSLDKGVPRAAHHQQHASTFLPHRQNWGGVVDSRLSPGVDNIIPEEYS